MEYEVEQKFPVADMGRTMARLDGLGVQWRGTVEQFDLYFAHPSRDFGTTDEALRIRRVGEVNRLTYKGPKIDASTKTRREIELPVGEGERPFQQLRDLLQSLGFKPVRPVEKQRRVGHVDWDGTGVEIAVDQVVDLGVFVELELMAFSDQLDEARRKIHDLAAALELTQPERRGYLEMLLAREAGADARDAPPKPDI